MAARTSTFQDQQRNVSPVARISDKAFALRKNLDMTRALMGGTETMRLANTKYLPKWPKEKQENYNTRLAVSTLFPAYSRTVNTLVGKPFSQPVKLSENMPESIKKILADVDMEGRNIDTYAAERLQMALAHGIAGILVDFPDRGDTPNTQEAEQKAGLRPYWVDIEFWNILGWKYKTEAGKKVLTQLRFFEWVEEDDGEFGVKDVCQIKVLLVGGYEIWRETEKKGIWTRVQKITGTTNTEVRFVPLYGEYLDFMAANPPLIELAYLNIKHWQSQSDQDNIVHVIRAPILAYNSNEMAPGPDGKARPVELTISPNMGVRIPMEADIKYVEHTGKAVETARKELDELKDEMRQSGAELLVMRMTQATATEVSGDNSVGTCALQRIVNRAQDGFNLAIQYTADWIGEKNPGTISIFNDFGLDTMDQAVAQLVLEMADDSGGKKPIISRRRAYNEYQRRGILSPDTQYEEEQKEIESQPKSELPKPAPVPGNLPAK